MIHIECPRNIAVPRADRRVVTPVV
jgi:hypothetical protein